MTKSRYICLVFNDTEFVPRATRVEVCETDGETLFIEDWPLIDAATVRLVVEHAGWNAVSRVHDMDDGWWQYVEPRV